MFGEMAIRILQVVTVVDSRGAIKTAPLKKNTMIITH